MTVLAAVDVVVVHYRSRGLARDLVRDLMSQQDVDLKIIIVESGSDGTVESVVAEYGKQIEVIDLNANVGYCRGNNIGAQRSRTGSLLLVCNPDVRLPDVTTVASLAAILRVQPELAAVAPGIMTMQGQLEYINSTVNLERALAHHTETHVDAETEYGTRTLSWINGACLLITPEAWRATGGFDERFFLFCEEVDWCIRARNLGFKVLLDTSVRVRHQRGGTFDGRGVKASYYFHRNLYYLCQLHAHGSIWKLWWLSRCLRVVARPSAWTTGIAPVTAWAVIDAIRGRVGPRPFRP